MRLFELNQFNEGSFFYGHVCSREEVHGKKNSKYFKTHLSQFLPCLACLGVSQYTIANFPNFSFHPLHQLIWISIEAVT